MITALISLSDKTGIEPFAAGLQKMGIAILSTGGTARLLSAGGIKVEEVSRYTGAPEMMGGRVKTLHPKVHGGILARRGHPKDLEEARAEKIRMIDLVVVNLYPFVETLGKPGATEDEIVEQIDIGGPTLVRAAAKNYRDVTVVVDPKDYPAVLDELEREGGGISAETRRRLAAKAFAHVAQYDAAISNWFESVPGKGPLPAKLSLHLTKVMDLRYGENPHQAGAWYSSGVRPAWTEARIHQGKELSYNNLLDAESAWAALEEFAEAGCVIVKHNTPCGAAVAQSLHEAFTAARDTDPTSAFGGVIALNRALDEATAAEIAKDFFEVVLVPGFAGGSREILARKKQLRVIEMPQGLGSADRLEFRRIAGGFLIQEKDRPSSDECRGAKLVSKREPTTEERRALEFAWKIVKHVKSNAIVFATAGRTLGLGAGQMSRVDAVRIAVQKSGISLKAAVMASDAFFPFRDGIDEAARAGITAVIHPGGSIRDAEVIDAANEHGMAMLVTGVRHFRH